MNKSPESITRKKIWIIDDEVDLCLLMKSYFLRKNCEVRISHQLPEALLRMREDKPNIIFLDRGLCDNLKENKAQVMEAAPGARLIITGEGAPYNMNEILK